MLRLSPLACSIRWDSRRRNLVSICHGHILNRHHYKWGRNYSNLNIRLTEVCSMEFQGKWHKAAQLQWAGPVESLFTKELFKSPSHCQQHEKGWFWEMKPTGNTGERTWTRNWPVLPITTSTHSFFIQKVCIMLAAGENSREHKKHGFSSPKTHNQDPTEQTEEFVWKFMNSHNENKILSVGSGAHL